MSVLQIALEKLLGKVENLETSLKIYTEMLFSEYCHNANNRGAHMESIPYSHLEKGTFLIATPEFDSGIFFRSVLLLCEHSPNGSFGIIVNKPLDLELPEEILTPDQLVNPNVEIRAGGPVQTNQMMLLHSSEKIPEQND